MSIESEGSRNSATERLLFDFDWNYTSLCFDRAKKSSAKDFAQRTRSALEAEAITPTPDDEMVLHALTKRPFVTAPPQTNSGSFSSDALTHWRRNLLFTLSGKILFAGRK